MDGLLMLSMVGATLPADPSVRKQKSIAFSMLFGRTIAYASSPPEGGRVSKVRKVSKDSKDGKTGRTGESGRTNKANRKKRKLIKKK